jgi:hypothetical protein
MCNWNLSALGIVAIVRLSFLRSMMAEMKETRLLILSSLAIRIVAPVYSATMGL